MRRIELVILGIFLSGIFSLVSAAEMGSFKYSDFQTPTYCSACHNEIYQEWEESLMAQSFTHKWDEIEYS